MGLDVTDTFKAANIDRGVWIVSGKAINSSGEMYPYSNETEARDSRCTLMFEFV